MSCLGRKKESNKYFIDTFFIHDWKSLCNIMAEGFRFI